MYFSHRAKEITKNFVQYNEFSNGIAQNGYYIQEFRKDLLNLLERIEFKKKKQICCLIKSQSILCVEKYEKSYTNNKFKTSALTSNDKSELLDGSYSVSQIQNYFEYIIKKYNTGTNNPPITIKVNKIENRITLVLSQTFNI